MNYYVYEWYIIETNEVFYVGKGKDERAEKLKNNKFFMDMYNSHNCNFRIMIDNLSEEEAFDYEKRLIKYYREVYPEYRLTNQTDGGEGTSGWHPSEEWKENQSVIHKQIWGNKDYRDKMIEIRNSDNSVYKTEEFRNKISKIVQGENNPNYGNYWTEEQKENLSKKMKGRYDGENNPNYGNHWSDEQKRHLSEIRKNKKYNNENHGMAKRIICLETGEIFKCIKYAQQKYKTIYILGNNKPCIKGYHFQQIKDDYIPDQNELFEILIDFYKKYNTTYKIFVCLETRKFIIGWNEIQKETKFGQKKIKTELRKNNKIIINNKTYIEIENYSRII